MNGNYFYYLKKSMSVFLSFIIIFSSCTSKIALKTTVPPVLKLKSGVKEVDIQDCINKLKNITANPENFAMADRLNKEGTQLAKSNNLEEAYNIFNKAIELNPTNPSIVYNYALVSHKLEKKQAAIDGYCRYLALKPDDPDKEKIMQRIKEFSEFSENLSPEAISYFKVGLGFAKKGLFDEAEESFEEAIDIEPEWAEAYFNRALVEEALIDFKYAIRDFEEYLELNPNAADKELVNEKMKALEITNISEFSFWKTFLFTGLVGYLAAILIIGDQ